MSVLTAHRILIATAVVFFTFYGIREVLEFSRGGGIPALLQGAASFLAAFGLGAYWRTIPKDD
jgi:hypothetical protein